MTNADFIKEKQKLLVGSRDSSAADFVEYECGWIQAELANQIIERMHGRKLTQAKAAELIGITQPRVADLMQSRLILFSLDASGALVLGYTESPSAQTSWD